MDRRVLLLLLVVIALIAVAAVVVLPGILNQPAPTAVTDNGTAVAPTETGPTATPIQLENVVVAVQTLPRGISIPAGALQSVPWPSASIPERARGMTIEKIAGKIARTDIYVQEPIVDSLLAEDLSQIAQKGSDAAAITPKGRVLISIPVDRYTDVAYAIADGDYVDIAIAYLFVDVDPNFQSIKPNKLTLTSVKADGTIELQAGIEGELQPSSFSQFPVVAGPSEPQRPRLATQRTIQAAWVVHVGNFPLDGQFLRPISTPVPTNTPAEGEPTKAAPPPTPTPPFPDIVTLAVEPQDAVVLNWAVTAQLPITLLLKSSQGDPRQTSDATTAVTLQYMIETFGVTEPSHLPFALEPALRSIRGLQAGNQIQLGQ